MSLFCLSQCQTVDFLTVLFSQFHIIAHKLSLIAMQVIRQAVYIGILNTQFLKVNRQPYKTEKVFQTGYTRQCHLFQILRFGNTENTVGKPGYLFGLCPATKVIHAGTITDNPAPCVTL